MAAYHYLGFLRGDDVAIDARWCAAFVGNIRFALVGTNYLGAQEPPSPLQHFWSLGVEEQFYLVWPSMMLLVAAVVPRRHLRISIGILLGIVISASLAWSYLQTNSDPGWAYFSPLTRAWELGVGASIAIGAPLVSRISPRLAIPISWIGLIGIVASAFIIDGATPFPGIAAIAPVLATALVIVGGAVGSGGGAVALLRRLPFQWVGKLSYSFYLWHWPILVIAAQHAGKRLSVAHNLVLLTGALALSAVTFYTVESPVRRSRALRGKDPIVVVVGLCLVIFTIAVSSWTLSRHAGII
jgi:peptidoglycan/LPS O-acetylase OafA/YrhL